MSHADTQLQPVFLNDGGSAEDTPADEVRTYWTAPDTESHIVLSDGSTVISARVDEASADAVRAEITERVSDGESTPVLAQHLSALGLREAVLEWATGG